MKIYKLFQHDSIMRRRYDEVIEFVVIAEDEGDARHFAARQAGDETSRAWKSPDKTHCVEVGTAVSAAPQGVICRDFNAG